MFLLFTDQFQIFGPVPILMNNDITKYPTVRQSLLSDAFKIPEIMMKTR